MNLPTLSVFVLLFLAALGAFQRAHAFGVEGHRIAGLIAETYLCPQARIEVDRLVDGESLAEIGLWADRVRRLPRWENSGPWHFLNIADGASLSDYESPREGDILWAIAHFRSRLADRTAATNTRSEALKFLVHFVVDLHQPLHVGRSIDRGGTLTEVSHGSDRITLHRFWDTEAIPNAGLSAVRYVRKIMPITAAEATNQQRSEPLQWARESMSLRSVVYNFDLRSGRLDLRYRELAGELVQQRLIQAGLRLAVQLNGVSCPGEGLFGP